MTEQTYCLRYFLPKVQPLKRGSKTKLTAYGIQSFVEGTIDQLDALKITRIPIAISVKISTGQILVEIYSFNLEFLRDVGAQMKRDFQVDLLPESSLDTKLWQEG